MLWRRPCCLDYRVCQNCEGNKRRKKRKWARLAFSGAVGHMPHTHKHKAPLQKLSWILEAISSFGLPRNHVITRGQPLFASDTCTGGLPHWGPPALSPEDFSWKPLSDPIAQTSVGLSEALGLGGLITRSEADKGAGSPVLLCMCMW